MQFSIVVQLLEYWHEPNCRLFPSKRDLAERMGVTEKAIQCIKPALLIGRPLGRRGHDRQAVCPASRYFLPVARNPGRPLDPTKRLSMHLHSRWLMAQPVCRVLHRQCRRTIANADNVSLNSVIGGVRGHAGRHNAFEE